MGKATSRMFGQKKTNMPKSVLTLLLLLAAYPLSAQQELENYLQSLLTMAEDGSTIEFPEGTFFLSNHLQLEGKKNVTLRGAGQGKTVLSFNSQKQKQAGLKIAHSRNIVLEQLTLEDAQGELLQCQQVNGLTVRDITAQWTGGPKASNGSSALSSVQCKNVQIERCTLIGASQAGIYIEQSDSVWVSNCMTKQNVAGIEIVNTNHAWVWKNKAFDNTGGILICDLPGLMQKSAGYVKVYDNLITRNNLRNHAPKGDPMGELPPGTGLLILAGREIEVSQNKIWDNRTASTAILSYSRAQTPNRDTAYNPYPSRIFIHDNLYSMGKRMPVRNTKTGLVFWLKFGKKPPHILYDGIQNPDWLDAQGVLKPAYAICIRNNENGSFANLHRDKRGWFKRKISRDLNPFDCEL